MYCSFDGSAGVDQPQLVSGQSAGADLGNDELANLPFQPPIKPMLAKAVVGIPERDDLAFEPKWDGFRCIVFRDGDQVHLGSRNSKPLTRYFPELVDPIRDQLPDRVIFDCEIIVAIDNRLEFDQLQQRIHPAESRVNMLAEKTPAEIVAFDLLALDDRDLREAPFGERRELLESVFADVASPLHLTPVTRDRDIAQRWFVDFEGAGLDGLIAKPLAEPYAENKRSQLKVKHIRSADAVVAGYRIHKDGNGVGSLMLGLFDDDGDLRHVGVAASFTAVRRTELLDELAPLTENALDDHPWATWSEAGAQQQNRWNANKDMGWLPVRPEWVAEVKYGSTLNGRFREVTKMLRWRHDKEPSQCDYDQLDEPIPIGLDKVLNP
jgi:ATP-dependent DNA ligase